ncbi:MAG: type 4a pilus biogenesis protein PilO [Candidatus Auribacterota bacterium]|nr:type 4a pilus biogenesis protein PilO [Candidatus Auribacterota bacterium]
MNYTQKALAILIGFILILVLFWLFVYSPASNKLGELKEEVKDLDHQLIEYRAKQANLPEIRDKIESARRRLGRLEVQYPRTIEVVYQAITEAAREVGFSISTRNTGEKQMEEAGTALREYEINIKAFSSYRVLGEFLYRIVNSPIIISISELAIISNRDAPVEGGKKDELRVKMKLTTYLSRTN